ncbi:MAG: aminotransferase class I/II-fold pyridoxal phosphate-dependent enzyme, partial [Spirochaetes bacterium]|nr:aminotransferase class I/II-fold pyridoxal phosphate-dependent enzyme [Spirochaetota bacterium]
MDNRNLFQHGGNLDAAGDYYQLPASSFIDFSANINAFIDPDLIKKLIQLNFSQVFHYPDPDYKRLYQALADFYQLPVPTFYCGNGSIELIYQLVQFLSPEKSLIIQPNFSEYEKALLMTQSQIEHLNGKSENHFKVSVENIIQTVQQFKINVVFLSNPNNPAGYLYQVDEIEQILKECPQIHLVLDEAFIEFVDPSRSLLTKISNYPQLIILRSLTKILAIPGLRLGFLCAHKNIIHRLKEKQIPWHINSFAKIIGENINQY